MQFSEYPGPSPEAFRGFLEGVKNFQEYLRTNEGDKLVVAEEKLGESLSATPGFPAAQYYQAIVLTHARNEAVARTLLENLLSENAGTQFRAEVLYNLAFAYAREYDYKLFSKSLSSVDEAYYLAHRHWGNFLFKAKRPDLVFLILAMRAWVMAVFGGRSYGNAADFQERRQELLPGSAALSQAILSSPRLKGLSPETRRAVAVESHNAAGIAFMRMGQYAAQFKSAGVDDPLLPRSFTAKNHYWLMYDLPRLEVRGSDLLGKPAKDYWELALKHYSDALQIHPRDVRVLDNISTLSLIQACYFWDPDHDAALRFSEQAKEKALLAISYNRHDRFRHNNLARAEVLLGNWDAAKAACKETLKERGKVTDDSVAELLQAIDETKVQPVLEAYPNLVELPA